MNNMIIYLLYEYDTSISYSEQPNLYIFRSIYQVLLHEAIYPKTIL